VASVTSFALLDLETEQEFLKWILARRANATPQTNRYPNFKEEVNLVHGRGALCVRIDEATDDKAAQIGTEANVMVVEGISYLCQHPKNKGIGVRMDYSHRHFAGNADPAMETKANAFLDQVQFTDF
jgi:hypothetical protein